jgi:hypothetical protein
MKYNPISGVFVSSLRRHSIWHLKKIGTMRRRIASRPLLKYDKHKSEKRTVLVIFYSTLFLDRSEGFKFKMTATIV